LYVVNHEEEFRQCNDDDKIKPPNTPYVDEILLERPIMLERQLDVPSDFY